MSKFRVPKQYRDTLHALAALEEQVFEGLLSRLSSDPLPVDISALKERVELAPAGPVLDADALVEGLLHMQALRKSWRMSEVEFAEELSMAEGLSIPDGASQAFQDRLSGILRSRAFKAFAHALEVGYEHGRLFQDARVLTDIRPIFLEDEVSEPDGAVVSHTLRIDFMEDRRVRTTYLALDEADLLQLRIAVNRAFKKRESLLRLLQDAGTPIYDLRDENDLP